MYFMTKFDLCNEEVDIRAKTYELWSWSCRTEVRNKKNNNNKKRTKTLEKTEKEMKTNLPSTIRLILFSFFSFFFGVSARFYLIKYAIVYISFEGRTEMSIEVLTSVSAVFTVGCMRDFS